MIAYRLANYGNPLRTEAARRPARYHTGTEASPTQYLCLHPLGPFAEFVRSNSLERPEQVRHIHERTWTLRVSIESLPEITFGGASRRGLEAADLVSDDYSACQRIATALRVAGVPGLIVPSAALPGTRNIVLFGPRVGAPYLLDPVSAIDVPAGITAHRGRPPASLLERVCFVGQRHAALDAWAKGGEFTFEEPDWSLTPED